MDNIDFNGNIEYDIAVKEFIDFVASQHVHFSSQEAGRATLNSATTEKKKECGIKLQIDKAKLLETINKGYQEIDEEEQR